MNADRIRRGSVAVAYSLFLLVVGALVVQPASAALGIDWGTAWKKEIKPRADQRYYTKAQAQQRFGAPKVLRGVYAVDGDAIRKSAALSTELDFGGLTLAAAPKVHFISMSNTAPAACPGTAALPDAKPGHLCVYESSSVNIDYADSAPQIVAPVHGGDASERYGATIRFFSEGVANMGDSGTWAVRAPKS